MRGIPYPGPLWVALAGGLLTVIVLFEAPQTAVGAPAAVVRTTANVVSPAAVVVAAPVVRHAPRCTHDDVLRALRLVESGGRANPPDGDGGRALGPFQIWRAYWRDAVAHDASLARLDGRRAVHADCRNAAYAARVVEAYLRRHAAAAWAACDAERLARIHNGGPRGGQRASTLRYWRRVQEALAVAER